MQRWQIVFKGRVQRDAYANTANVAGCIDQSKIARDRIEKFSSRSALATKIETQCTEDLSGNDLIGGDALVRCDLLDELLCGRIIGIASQARKFALNGGNDRGRRPPCIFIQIEARILCSSFVS